MPMLLELRNYSMSLDDVTIYNFRSTERIFRFLNRIKDD